jgi:hypothetical protein
MLNLLAKGRLNLRLLQRLTIALLLASSTCLLAQSAAPKPLVCEKCLRDEISFLADDKLRGRGSATADELTAAEHIAGVFKKLGLEPVGSDYIIPVIIERGKFTAPPKLTFSVGGKQTTWTHGVEMLSPRLTHAEVKGKLVHVKPDPAAAANLSEDSVAVIADAIPNEAAQAILGPFFRSKAAAVIVVANKPYLDRWSQFANRPAELPTTIAGEPETRTRVSMIAVKADALKSLADAPAGTEITISGPTAPDKQETRNVVAVLRGSDPVLKSEYIMFSAHMDHLGVCAKSGDTICNGADDDASGTATVLELARIFTAGERPKRSLVFTTYGAEELGLIGSRGFAAKPPIPLSDIVADIEFEQTGLPESKVGGKGFWMTGSSFSDLSGLLREHGSQVSEDPYPGNPFFRQSDNFSLAAKGVVAHTMSGAAEFPDYHKPGDEASKLNYGFMAKSLESVLPGLQWLVNTDAKPKYFPGKNPAVKP